MWATRSMRRLSSHDTRPRSSWLVLETSGLPSALSARRFVDLFTGTFTQGVDRAEIVDVEVGARRCPALDQIARIGMAETSQARGDGKNLHTEAEGVD